LAGGPKTFGFLVGAAGVGALVGALYLASKRTVVGLGKTIPAATALFGAGLVCFSLSRTIWLSQVLMLITGFGMIVQMASSNTLLQTVVEDDKRGRVMSFYTMSFMGMVPLGSLLSGALAGHIGAPRTLLIGGLVCILGALVFARRLPALDKLMHPIYVRKGIIREVPVEGN
ncbi:MAG: MFS transporter, partial [Candidatus Eisenbacteria bacterium]